MTDLNEIRERIEDHIYTLREMVNDLRTQLRDLERAGMPNIGLYEAYVVAHLATLTDHQHDYLTRDTTLSDLLDAVDEYIEEKEESEVETE